MQEPGYLVFRARIVANAPVGMVDCLLKINQQKNGAMGQDWNGYVATGLSGANSPAPASVSAATRGNGLLFSLSPFPVGLSL